jgi:integrase/recombinase XerD
MFDLIENIIIYLDYCKNQSKLNEKTIKAYTIDLIQFQNHMNGTKRWIDKSEISCYITELHKKYAPNSVKRKIASINAFFSYLWREEVIAENPMNKIKTKFHELKILPKIIPLFTVEKILSVAYNNHDIAKTDYSVKTTQRDIAIIELLFATGMRVSELCSINIEDINFEECSVLIMGKGARERIIQVINTDVMNALKRYKEKFNSNTNKSSALFVNRLCLRLTEQSVRLIINRLCTQAGINLHITPHMFRHYGESYQMESDYLRAA